MFSALTDAQAIWFEELLKDRGKEQMTTKVLFVCLGNICRSPTAEGVFRKLVADAGLSAQFEIDSAGTGSRHVGETPDKRAQQACRAHGIDISKHRARRVRAADFESFDLILACDEQNLRDLTDMKPQGATAEIRLLMPFAGNPADRVVPDPYYGGPGDFENTVQRACAACAGLLRQLSAK